MATKSSTLNVGTQAVSLLPVLDRDNVVGQRWTAYNAGTNTVWAGDENVSVGSGIPIPPGAYARESFMPGDVLYGVAPAATQLNIKQDGV